MGYPKQEVAEGISSLSQSVRVDDQKRVLDLPGGAGGICLGLVGYWLKCHSKKQEMFDTSNYAGVATHMQNYIGTLARPAGSNAIDGMKKQGLP